MARTGIDRLDVENAIVKILNNNERPTVERIRALLGTGSYSTINPYLKAWQARQGTAPSPFPMKGVPAHLADSVKLLWENIQEESHKKILAIEEETHNAILAMEKKLSDAEREKADLQHQAHQLNDQLHAQTQKAIALEKALEESRIATARFQEKIQGLESQAVQQKAENAKLHILCKQTQTNFTHYQEEQQKLLQAKALETEKIRLQWHEEIMALKSQIEEARRERQTVEMQATRLQDENHALLNQKNSAETLIHSLQAQSQQQLADLTVAEQQLISVHEQHTALAQSCEKLQAQVLALEKSHAVLADQNGHLKSSLQQADTTIALLRAEKYELAQEKAHLTGQLTQLFTSTTSSKQV